ncbi:tyrosine-protein phosphatase [Alphaproteobacteria bacterium]|nr:tyrosine-protein phosphatase [Alphaproteobacteria bacterium]
MNKRIIPNLSNFRDLGGCKNSKGSMIKNNQLYRSNHFYNLSSNDLKKIKNLKIKTVVDLRSKEEIKISPFIDKLSVFENIYSFPVAPKSGYKLQELISTKKITSSLTEKLMIDSYISYARDFQDQYSSLIKLISNKKNLPLVFHCSAGKDRTGFASALIYLTLDVSLEQIYNDYLYTNELWKPSERFSKDLSKSVSCAMLLAHQSYLESSMNQMIAMQGSLNSYIDKELMINSETILKINKNLLI